MIKRGQPSLFMACYMVLAAGLVILLLGAASWTWASSWQPRSVIKKYLKGHYPWAEIEILDIVGEITSKVPPERVYMINGPLGRARFSMIFKSGEKAVVQANIRAMDWVVTTRRPLKRSQVIQKEDVYMALMDVRRMPRDALTRLEGAWGKMLTQSLGANMPVVENYMGEIPIIKKGQRITLVASCPGLKITAPGEARQDGYSGQTLKVINLTSKRNVQGILVDENHVQVLF